MIHGHHRQFLMALSASVLVTLLGAVFFWTTDDPFQPLFAAGLVLSTGGIILTGLLLSFPLIGSPRWWWQALGYFLSGTLLLLTLVLLIAAADYRIFFRRHPTKAEWRQDLQVLANAVTKIPPRPLARASPKQLQSEAAAIEADLPHLSDAGIILRLARLVAMLREGDSSLDPFQLSTGFEMYPLRLHLFGDGIYVTSAIPPYVNLTGLRLAKINSTPVEQAFEALSPLVSADNEETVKDRIPPYLVCVEVLRSKGIISGSREALFTFEDDHARPATVALKPVSLIAYFYWSLRPLANWKHKAAADPGAPLSSRNRFENYWFTYIDGSKAVYLAFNQIRNQRRETLDELGRRLLVFTASHRVERLVIDLRNNSGGDTTLYGSLLDRISQSTFNEPGRLFALTGRHTRSAAVDFAAALQARTRVILIGEPTGTGPNRYEDPRGLTLPNSKIFVLLSAPRNLAGDPSESRSALIPEIPVTVSHQDYFAGHDPVLDAALSLDPRRKPALSAGASGSAPAK